MAKQKRTGESVNHDFIEVFGAREHNLKNVDIRIPKHKLVVFTGVSGSGKSSLAFDTIYNEGQRRYMESFSAYARQFVGDMERPDVDKITGLSPVISIEQKTTNKNPRSTVGTITEIYDFLRLLFARASDAYSYATGKKMVKFSEEEIVASVFSKYKDKKISVLAPLIRGRKGHYRELFEDIRKKGFVKVRVDGEVLDLTARMQVDRYKIHDIEVVIDRIKVTPEFKLRLSQSVQSALTMGKGLLFILVNDDNKVDQFSRQLMCLDTGISYEEPSPNAFSFNSPYGACPKCKGLGTIYQVNLEAVIPDRSLSVKEGAIVPLGEEREAYVYKQVQQLSKKNKFSLDKAVKDLSPTAVNLLLYGKEKANGEEDTDEVEEQSEAYYQTEYEGVVNMVKRWYASPNTSEGVRQWAEQFMKLHECPECHGTRLKKESLWFKVNGRNISELSNMDLDKLVEWFDKIEKKLSDRQNAIARDVLKEIRDRLSFLLDVGLN